MDSMPPFSLLWRVSKSEIDALGHVNNEIYLAWMLRAAIAHSESLGYGLERFKSEGGAFVVRRHEIDYLAPAFLGDELKVHTWPSMISSRSAEREYVIERGDGKKVARGKTYWVFLDLETGRAKQIPLSIKDAFSPENYEASAYV